MNTKEIEKLNQSLLKASKFINERNFAKAKTILNEYLQVTEPLIKSSRKEKQLCFNNIVEFYAYTKKSKQKKNVNWLNLKCDVAYQWLAYIANEEKDFVSALKYIKKGLTYNPMNVDLYFEKIETYKLKKDYLKLMECEDEVYPLIFNYKDLARYYRNLGYFYIEQGIYEVAYALYAFSLEYFESNNAHYEIEYILKAINNPKFNISFPEIINIFLKNKIKIGAVKENINILKDLIQDEKIGKDNLDLKYDIEQNLFILTKNETFYHSVIVPLKEKRVRISEECYIALSNIDRVLKQIKNKEKEIKIEYFLETRSKNYHGQITIDNKFYLISESLEDNDYYDIKMYGLFLAKEEDNNFLELKIASKE